MLSCKPFSKKTPVVNLAVQSDIVVKVKAKAYKGKEKVHNATAVVTQVFQTRTGGLQVNSEVSFGLVGKNKSCTKLKHKRAYILFLQNANQNNFHAISFNPIKATSKIVQALEKKYLCKNCLKPASFKRKSKVVKAAEGKKLKIRCKAKGKPKPTIEWYYNNELLTKSNTPEEFVIKNRKKGGSGTIEITELEQKHDKAHIVCRAKNPITSTPVNFTIEIKVTKFLSGEKCKKSCNEEYSKNYCFHGQCCQDSLNSLRCRCYTGFHGDRCQNRHVASIRRNPLKQMSLKYRHMQRMVAVLGMCLALMFVVFLCFSVYCLFKRRRTTMLYDILTKKSPSTTKLEEPDSEHNLAPDARPPSSQNGDHVEENESNNTRPREDSSRSNYLSPTKKPSLHSVVGRVSVRGRLNGVTKDLPHRSPASRLCASREDSPVLVHAASNSISIEKVFHSYQEAPSLPSDSHVTTNFFPTPNSLNHLGVNTTSNKPRSRASSISSLSNRPMATFQADEKLERNVVASDSIRKNGLDLEEESFSLSSNQSFPLQISFSPRVPNSSKSVNSSSKRILNSNNQSRSSDNDDPFGGIIIPDTSLELYSNTPNQSLQRISLRHQKARDYEEPHYATPVVRTDHDVRRSSAQTQQLPLLSKQEDNCELSLSDERLSDDSDSHQIEV